MLKPPITITSLRWRTRSTRNAARCSPKETPLESRPWYTPNATYIELLPRLLMMGGRARIEEHFRDLFKAHATELKSSVTSASRIDGDNALGGDY
jgi:hypothetical protein